MSSTAPPSSEGALRRIASIQVITIGWMMVEAAISLFAAWRPRSPALLAFGGDSAIELLSAAVVYWFVYWRFQRKGSGKLTEHLAARIAGGLLFVLAGYVAFVASGVAWTS